MSIWSCHFGPDKYLFNKYFLTICCTVGTELDAGAGNIGLIDTASTVFKLLELLLFGGASDINHVLTGRM